MENFIIVFSVLLYVLGFSITIFILDFFLQLQQIEIKLKNKRGVKKTVIKNIFRHIKAYRKVGERCIKQ